MNILLDNLYDRNNVYKECLVFTVNGNDNLKNFTIGDASDNAKGNFTFPDWAVEKGTSVYLYSKGGLNETVSYRGAVKHILFRGSEKAFWQEGDVAEIRK